MNNLKTNYLGLQLSSPIIVSSNGLSNSIEKIKQMEKFGAGAIILKSLFEEQILHETSELLKTSPAYSEAGDYISNYTKSHNLEKYFEHIKLAKQSVKTPIIASINCVSAADWTNFAYQIKNAGADALELNIHLIPISANIPSAKLEQIYFDIVKSVKEKVNIPVAVKISNQFTNLAYMAEQLKAHGADALVLFNRFYEPDIDTENMEMSNAAVFSHNTDYHKVLRWVGLLDGRTAMKEISATTGVHDPVAAIKLILAGASTVQLASVLYQEGIEQINVFNEAISQWMKKMNFESVQAFKGKMSYKNLKNPAIYERAQFMKYFSSLE